MLMHARSYVVFDAAGAELVHVPLAAPPFALRGDGLVLRRAKARVAADGLPDRYVVLDADGQELLSGPQSAVALQVGDVFDPVLVIPLQELANLRGGARLVIHDADGSQLAMFDMGVPVIDGSTVRFKPASTVIARSGTASRFRLVDLMGVVILQGVVIAADDPLPSGPFIAFSSTAFQADGEVRLDDGFTINVEMEHDVE